jgi:hypothetical protein
MQLVTVTAINEAHRLARQSAASAVAHAIRCGELLAEVKAALPHGQFQTWVAAHCEFAYPTAARYMKAARQKSTGVEFSTLSELFPSGRALPVPPESPPEPLPSWLPASGVLATATVGNWHAFVRQSDRNPGYYQVAVMSSEGEDKGGVVDFTRRAVIGSRVGRVLEILRFPVAASWDYGAGAWPFDDVQAAA